MCTTMICVLQCSSSSQKKSEPIFVNERGKEEGSGGEVNEVNDNAANEGLKVKEQSEAEEDLALGSHKTEPKVTPFKLKIPPKVEVASGSEIESSSELSAKLVVKKKKKSKKSKKKERREYREDEDELVAKDRKPPKRKIKEELVDNFKIESTEGMFLTINFSQPPGRQVKWQFDVLGKRREEMFFPKDQQLSEIMGSLQGKMCVPPKLK